MAKFHEATGALPLANAANEYAPRPRPILFYAMILLQYSHYLIFVPLLLIIECKGYQPFNYCRATRDSDVVTPVQEDEKKKKYTMYIFTLQVIIDSRPTVFDLLDLAQETLKTSHKATCLPLGLGRVQFLFDLSMVLQELIDGRHNNG